MERYIKLDVSRFRRLNFSTSLKACFFAYTKTFFWFCFVMLNIWINSFKPNRSSLSLSSTCSGWPEISFNLKIKRTTRIPANIKNIRLIVSENLLALLHCVFVPHLLLLKQQCWQSLGLHFVTRFSILKILLSFSLSFSFSAAMTSLFETHLFSEKHFLSVRENIVFERCEILIRVKRTKMQR